MSKKKYCQRNDIIPMHTLFFCDLPHSFTNHSPTFYSFAVHAVVVSVIVHYLSHAKNHD